MDEEFTEMEETQQEYDDYNDDNDNSQIINFVRKYSRIIFTAIMIILFIFFAASGTKKSVSEEKQQPEQSVQQEQSVPQEQDLPAASDSGRESKTTMDYLRELKIGKSNVVAFAVLGGILAYIQIKRNLEEKQKESK